MTTGYIYSNNVPEYHVEFSMALAGGAGKKMLWSSHTFGRETDWSAQVWLPATKILCMALVVASVWVPDSSFDLNYASKHQ